MAKYKVKLEFPCGMKIEKESSGLGMMAEFSDEDLCPLHGKNCNKK